MIININNSVSRSFDIRSMEEMNETWISITKEFMKSGHLLYSIEIDGILYYDNYAEELLSKYKEINLVNITIVSKEQSFYLTIQELQDYLEKVIPSLEDIIQPLYSGTENKELLPNVTESIQWIMTSLAYTEHLSKQMVVNQLLSRVISRTFESLTPLVQMLTEEMERDNLIGFADVIQYEFIPLVAEFYNKSIEIEMENIAN